MCVFSCMSVYMFSYKCIYMCVCIYMDALVRTVVQAGIYRAVRHTTHNSLKDSQAKI